MLVYLITNEINKKKYVGLTKRSLKVCWYEHVKKSKLRVSEDSLHYDILIYGKNNFKLEVLMVCDSISEMCVYEKKFILNLKTQEFGYNKNSGGKNYTLSDGYKKEMSKNSNTKKSVYVTNLETNEILRFISANESARSLNIDARSVFRVLSGKRKSHKGFFFSYDINSKFESTYDRRIYKFNLNGILLNEYLNIEECVKDNNIDRVYIYRVLSGKRKSHKGFVFSIEEISYTHKRMLYQEDFNTKKIIDVFNTIANASIKTKINASTISKIVNKKRNPINSYNFYWK